MSDNVIMIDYHHDHGTLKRSLAIIKTRASGHTTDMYEFRLGPDGITLDGTAPPGGEPARLATAPPYGVRASAGRSAAFPP
jgi:KaiC/GvpD/RAD55 family RecA-like ATPase